MRRHTLAAGAAALSFLLASCGSSSAVAGAASTPSVPAAATPAASSETVAPAPGGIVISAFAYSGTLTVKAGQKVTVTNQDLAAHTLTDKKAHLFDTGNIAGKGGTGTFTAPTKPGSYSFGCTYHRHMEGTLVVRG